MMPQDRPHRHAELHAILADLGTDEMRVITLLARRLRDGQRQYGLLDLATDKRDWRKERGMEAADSLMYAAFEFLTTHVDAVDAL